MNNETTTSNWAKISGKLLGQIAAVYFAVAFAALVLIVPTKVLFMFCSWIWKAF